MFNWVLVLLVLASSARFLWESRLVGDFHWLGSILEVSWSVGWVMGSAYDP